MSDSSEVYYVVLRGAGRARIFNDDEDRRHFTDAVAQATRICSMKVHAYCWLRTEARLALEPAEVPIGQFAECVAHRHARRLKRSISLTGSHFEQKYRGVLVDGQRELAELVRHIHLAPLKAGLADDLDEYPWSSHLVYMGLQETSWVTTQHTLRHFAGTSSDPRVAYLEFMKQGARALEVFPAAGAPPENPEPTGRLPKK